MHVKTQLTDDVSLLKLQLIEKQQRIDYLENQIKLFRHNRFGQSSEAFSPDQLSLLGNDSMEAKQLQSLIDDKMDVSVKSFTRRKKSRIVINELLPVEKIIIDLDEKDKTCSCCNNEMTKIDEETTHEVEYIPATLVAKDYVRLKYACKHCEGDIKLAKLPNRLIPKSIASASLVANLIVSKFVDHLPLHRIERQFERLGLGLPRNVQCDWLLKIADKLLPLYMLHKAEALSGPRLWTDDTILPMQNDIKQRKRTIQARLWVYMGGNLNDPPTVFYDFTRSRSQAGPLEILKGYEGYLHADAYPGYDKLFISKKLKEVGCWAHARKKFHEIAKLTKKPHRAHVALAYIQKLYAIERETKILKLDYDEIKLYRQAYSKPILKEYKAWLDVQINAVARGALKGALKYTLNQWDALNTHLEEGYLMMDNNASERRMKPIALGRKNYIFVGSERGGQAAAIYYSIVETCKNYKINPLQYLTDILLKLPNCKTEEDYKELLPKNWIKK